MARRLRELCQPRHFATRDSLTGLPNRKLLLDRLRWTLTEAARYRKRVMLVVIELDGFRLVNGMYGHGIGDDLLRQVAARLRACTRFCDTVCRYGGDKFMVMLPEVDATEDAEAVAGKIRSRLAAPYALGKETMVATVSVGTAVCDDAGRTSSELIDRADAAMQVEKIRHDASAADDPKTA